MELALVFASSRTYHERYHRTDVAPWQDSVLLASVSVSAAAAAEAEKGNISHQKPRPLQNADQCS